LKRYGNTPAIIQKEYFSDCNPPVSRQDVANFINTTPHLKDLAKIGISPLFLKLMYINNLEHKNLKTGKKNEFNASINAFKKEQIREEEEDSSPIMPPSIKPFFFENENHVGYYCRYLIHW
jgi:hypothetical protein